MNPEQADYRARVFVNGLVDEILFGGVRTGKKRINSGHWHERFHDHPWVQASNAEGWARDLRSAVIAEVRRRISANQPYFDLNQLMPDADWVEHQRKQAARYEAARKWRDEVSESHGSVDAWLTKHRGGGRGDSRPLAAPMRDVFEAMQKNSQLTERTRRMMGDDE